MIWAEFMRAGPFPGLLLDFAVNFEEDQWHKTKRRSKTPLSACGNKSSWSFFQDFQDVLLLSGWWDQKWNCINGLALMLEKCSVSSRQRAGWCCPREFVLEASRAPLRLISRISLFSFLPEGLKSQDNSGCSFTGVRTLRNQGDQNFGEQLGRNWLSTVDN